MRLELPHHVERFGAVRIYGVQEVYELDSGQQTGLAESRAGWQTIGTVGWREINEIERRMAVVVPVKNERLKIIEGVLSGIPHDALLIIVSNSDREPVDRYEMETDALASFVDRVDRQAMIVHQQDPGLGAAFEKAGMTQVVDEHGVIRPGKGEGMLVAAALAKLAGCDYVGYIDADNYVPGAVHEYVKAYAAGFAFAKTPYAMVRISWRSKPKIVGSSLFFNRWGRSSQITNRFLNLLISSYSGFGTERITTGNAGEHAMTVDLALRMRFGAGFSVEPYQYIDLFEQFGGVLESQHPEVLQAGVEVFQIETRNPHFHEDKGADHVQEMRLQALNVLYHSEICKDSLRGEIAEFLRNEGILEAGEDPPRETSYPMLSGLDWDSLHETLLAEARTLFQTEVVEKTVPASRLPRMRLTERPAEDREDLDAGFAVGIPPVDGTSAIDEASAVDDG